MPGALRAILPGLEEGKAAFPKGELLSPESMEVALLSLAVLAPRKMICYRVTECMLQPNAGFKGRITDDQL